MFEVSNAPTVTVTVTDVAEALVVVATVPTAFDVAWVKICPCLYVPAATVSVAVPVTVM